MTRRPTKRALVFVGVGGLLVVVGSTAQAGWLFVLAAIVFGVTACSLLTPSRLTLYDATRLLPPRATVGDEPQVHVSLRNASTKRFLPAARVVDMFEPFEPVAFACDGLPPSGVSTVRVHRQAVRRGVYSGGEIVVTSGWPFGLMRSTRSITVVSPITVVPRFVELASFPLSRSSSVHGRAERSAARAGAGEQFLGVREYRAGDDARHIHWRSSARRGNLVVREYEDEAVERVALLLSGSDDGRAPESSFESLVSAVASVARYGLNQNMRVELWRTEMDGGSGRFASSNLHEILDWLACARSVDAPLLPLVLSAVSTGSPPGEMVVFSTSTGRAGEQLTDAANIVSARGVSVVSVIADSASWNGDAGSRPLPSMPGPGRVLSRGCDLSKCLQG